MGYLKFKNNGTNRIKICQLDRKIINYSWSTPRLLSHNTPYSTLSDSRCSHRSINRPLQTSLLGGSLNLSELRLLSYSYYCPHFGSWATGGMENMENVSQKTALNAAADRRLLGRSLRVLKNHLRNDSADSPHSQLFAGNERSVVVDCFGYRNSGTASLFDNIPFFAIRVAQSKSFSSSSQQQSELVQR